MSKTIFSDTIAAPATPPGRGGIAIIRISGPFVTLIAEKILGKVPSPRVATWCSFRDEEHQSIDEGVALFFPSPHSFTGEDILELQGHGGPFVVDCLMRRILQLGARFARPGEFSERAFLNNKMDLAQAEAVADLINAASEQSARASMRSLQGEFSKKITVLVEALIQLRMYIEAAIDFVDEDIHFLTHPQIRQDLLTLLSQLEALQHSAKQGSLLREGLTIVIIGQPNVGKSTLLNHLSGKNSAIVTDIPGTTRDVLREHIHLDGIPLHIIDTAGLRESADIVEQEGMRRTRDEMTRADLILCLLDAREDIAENKLLQDITLPTVPLFIIRNKIDLTKEFATVSQHQGKTVVALSAKEGIGIDLLKEIIKKQVGFIAQPEGIFSARRRHVDALTRAHQFLLNAKEQLFNIHAGELLAEDLRQAQLALSEITGKFTTDDLLGRIFASFCIGK